jgi:hypothetical protein
MKPPPPSPLQRERHLHPPKQPKAAITAVQSPRGGECH